MSDQATTTPGSADGANPTDPKGKGKAVEQPQDMSMDEDDEDTDDAGDEVNIARPSFALNFSSQSL